ncbi:DUF554 domain-containing protein [Romboutsia ilealis]|uniref:DUF554 domain-containing protein n=1 Tax=Romboutsia faecis TaxID=2764597 RepID=A0ABR7JPF7_9FIRM|nr:DUF554 domain-containing protein [Romboutsia faecis]MBC5996805.1 DUF554 domain-containing protein [Romboutsia faecis]MRN24689.1 DUF554 domain-containing protein [Romboutsia ilealis]
MLGTIVNTGAIIGGCLVGLLIKGGIPEKLSNTVMNGIALCVICIGISGSIEGENTLITIISMALGSVIGELIDLDKWLNRLGEFLESKFSKNKIKENSDIMTSTISISQGFVSASLLFCVGAMAVVGSLESGLKGVHEILFAKSILDGISSIIFTASMGIGVFFSGISVFIYQGVITIGASFLSGILSDSVVNEMTTVGSLLIMALGFNMIKVSNIKVANLLPAMIIPVFFGIFGMI